MDFTRSEPLPSSLSDAAALRPSTPPPSIIGAPGDAPSGTANMQGSAAMPSAPTTHANQPPVNARVKPLKGQPKPIPVRSLAEHGDVAPDHSRTAVERIALADQSPQSIRRELVAAEFYRGLAGRSVGSVVQVSIDASAGPGRQALERTLGEALADSPPSLASKRLRVTSRAGIPVSMPAGIAGDREEMVAWAADQVASGHSLSLITGSAVRTAWLASDLALTRPADALSNSVPPGITPAAIYRAGSEELAGAAGFQAHLALDSKRPQPVASVVKKSDLLSSLVAFGRELERERTPASPSFLEFLSVVDGGTPRSQVWNDIFFPGMPSRVVVSPAGTQQGGGTGTSTGTGAFRPVSPEHELLIVPAPDAGGSLQPQADPGPDTVRAGLPIGTAGTPPATSNVLAIRQAHMATPAHQEAHPLPPPTTAQMHKHGRPPSAMEAEKHLQDILTADAAGCPRQGHMPPVAMLDNAGPPYATNGKLSFAALIRKFSSPQRQPALFLYGPAALPTPAATG